ncbi:Gldg family protein [Candidatus Uabimicrobium sp. HlEnr_7]|uniref:Gldg family protein n=1 Tax=Candidatus Uabimicrobium helgolandensis TaxID=3095367 RepID=UPI0035567647
MRNIFTVLRRELATYFNSPIGYIFTFVFVALNIWLYQISFFSAPSANMRIMFQTLPFILIVFVPLVTMRLWAEERKENTIEMLLTFPMQPSHLVLGKYLASLIFFAISLAGTICLPIMLGALGSPDWGIILSSYIGALLLGSLFLAVGIFISGLVKDQIVAAVLSLGACFFLYIFGLDMIVASIDAMIKNTTGMNVEFGQILKSFLTVTAHYEPFVKGIIPTASLVYFLVWTGMFLFLNGMYLEGRNRKGHKLSFATSFVLCCFIGVFSNYLLEGLAVGRLDVTEHKIHTVSPATEKILTSLEGDVMIKLYISPKEELPIQLKSLEQQVADKLEEMRIVSSGKMKFSVVHMQTQRLIDDEEDEQQRKQHRDEESLEKSLMKKGVQPFQIALGEATKQSTQLIYSSMGIAYMDKKEEYIPRVVPQTLEELEYQVMTIIYRQTRDKQTVALVAPRSSIDPAMIPIMRQMGRPVPPGEYDVIERLLTYDGYEVKRVDLTKRSPLPEEFDTIVVLAPRKLNERQKWEISRALHNGKNVFLAVQNYEYDYRQKNKELEINRQNYEPGVNDWLEKYGVKIDEEVLMDSNNFVLTVQQQASQENPFAAMFGLQVDMPTHIIVTRDFMEQGSPITNRIDQVVYLWGSALDIDEETIKENKLTVETLMTTSDKAWKLPKTRILTREDRNPPLQGFSSYPLIALLKGQFSDADEKTPEWPKEPQQNPNQFTPPAPDSKVSEAKPAPGKLLVIGCGKMFSQTFLTHSLDLFRNGVDVLTTGGELSSIRSKKIAARTINKISDSDRTFWKVLNYLIIPLLIVIIGILRLQVRRITRDQYTMSVM